MATRTRTVPSTAADVMLAVGMRFDDRATGRLSSFARNAKVIHMDIDPAEIGKNVRADVPVVGDAKASLAYARRRTGTRPSTPSGWRRSRR